MIIFNKYYGNHFQHVPVISIGLGETEQNHGNPSVIFSTSWLNSKQTVLPLLLPLVVELFVMWPDLLLPYI